MDKYEYKLRSEEIQKLIDEEKYPEAVEIADTIDWRRVRSATTLQKIAALYRVNRRNEDSRDLLLLAFERFPTNRSILYSLCEVSIELDDVVNAIEYYKQFVKLAPRDNGVFTLRYKILEAQEASLEERIELLEELKKRDYQEEWGYELAYLYHRVGLETKCVEECDDIILWFGDGSIVMKAMELKMLHTLLTKVQQIKYDEMKRKQELAAQGIPVEEAYTDEYYGDESYADETYTNEEAMQYADDAYTGEDGMQYGDGTYAGGEPMQYADEQYAGEQYVGEESLQYADGQYAGETYADGEPMQYADGQYTDEPYADGTYAGEDGAKYADSQYADEQYMGEESMQYADETYPGEEDMQYAEEPYVADNYKEPAYQSEQPLQSNYDMSQYNTINLQKVVADSLKELLDKDEALYDTSPELNADVAHILDEDPEEMLSEEGTFAEEATDTENGINDMTGYVDPDAIQNEMQNIHTPGQQYAAPRHITGEMYVEEVVSEWERMKQAAEEKRKEKVRKLVQQQTGDMFVNFENAAKSGLLAGLEVPVGSQAVTAAAKTAEDVVSEVLFDEQNEIVDEELEEITELEELPEEALMEMDEMSDADNVEEMTEMSETDNILADVDEISEMDAVEELAEIEEADQIAELQAETLEEVEAESMENSMEMMTDEEIIYAEEDLPEDETVYADEKLPEDETVYAEEELAESEVVYADEEAIEENADYAVEELPEDETVYAEEELAEGEVVYADEEAIEENTDYAVEELPEDETVYAEEELAENEAVYADEEAIEDKAEYAEEETSGKAAEAGEGAVSMDTAEISSIGDKIIETTKKETRQVKKEELREFSEEQEELFGSFAQTKKVKKQILNVLDKITLASYTGNVIITGEPGLGTVDLAKNIVKEVQQTDNNFSGKVAKISGAKLNLKDLNQVFEKINNGALIIVKANGVTEECLYNMSRILDQENRGIIVIMEDTKHNMMKLLKKQAMIADYFNLRIDLEEMNNDALVAYAKNYALEQEYAIDEFGILALYTRIADIQAGNHVVTVDEVKDIVDEAIWNSKRFKIANFVDVLFAKRYDAEDMIVLRERDFI